MNRWLPFLSLFVMLVAALRAQGDIKYFHPEKFERATTTDDKGLVQWAEHKGDKCPTCAGTGTMKCTTCARFPEEAKICPECKRNEKREATCRPCAGTGTFPDPLEKVLCPGCLGASFLVCMVCHGGGQIRVTGSGDKWLACPGCREAGGFKCGCCNGSRLVEVAAVKPHLRDANAAALAKAMATTDQALQGIAAFTPTGKNSRKETKTLAKLFEGAQAVHPSLKRLPKVLDDYMGKIYGGAQFQGHEEHEAHAMDLVRKNTEFYLKHQKRMMELAHKRAEANEKVAAENKGK